MPQTAIPASPYLGTTRSLGFSPSCEEGSGAGGIGGLNLITGATFSVIENESERVNDFETPTGGI